MTDEQLSHIVNAHVMIENALRELEKAKSNERTPNDRKLAIVITDAEKVDALLTAWFSGR